jgi:hypothetical protein
MEAGEWEMRFRLHSNGVQGAQSMFARSLTRSAKERRLADARCTTDEERRATFMDMIDELLERLDLTVATDEDIHA